MRTTIQLQGTPVTFESPYSDDEAITILRGYVSRRVVLSSFADNLLRQVESGRSLSRRQLEWAYKLLHDAETRQQRQRPRRVTGQTRKAGSHRGR